MFILDGVDITDPNVRQPSVRPSVDAIQEFKVLTSAYSAEYGRQAGGMVVVTTKSGSNNIHGTLFEYVRNSMFDAKNYFEPANRPIADLRRNQFGGTIGGPIRKDRTFFFFNYEALRERKADTRVAAVPRTEWLGGDFSSLLNPGPGRSRVVLQNRLTGQPFPNNVIPANMLSPVALVAAKIFPAPTQNIDSHGGQFVGSPRQKVDTSLITTRVDHQFSQNMNLFFRYSYTRENLLSPFDSRTTISDLPFFSMDDQTRPHALTVSRVCWVTDQTPADLSGTKDRAAVEIGIMPPPGGSVFRIVDFPPETAAMRNLDPSTMHQSLGDGVPKRGLPPRHPAMHRTRTVDYAIVMSGEIDMLLDDSEVHLKAGDVLVQQGTNHAWVNHGTEPCRIAFVLIDSKEP